MALWIRFEHDGQTRFGTLDNGTVNVHEGNMFDNPRPTGETLPVDDVKLLTPTEPTKMLALWNNFHALAEKLGVSLAEEPLYLLKANSSFAGPDEYVPRPKAYDGKVAFEGELGIVIGKTCKDASEQEAADAIFGYTCINDISAVQVLNRDPNFPQWTRAKSYDRFGAFGPAVATGLDPKTLRVKTVLNGDVRQDYPISDMVFPAERLVSLISHDMTLNPGDVIACGTSVGVGSMKPGSTVEVTIDGIGTLRNTFD